MPGPQPHRKVSTVFLTNIVKKAAGTRFGKDHDFAGIRTYEDFRERVPIRDYEALKPYVEMIKEGGENILWPGRPLYFAKNLGYHLRGEVHSPDQRQSFQSLRYRPECIVQLRGTLRKFRISGRQDYLPVRES